MRSGLFPSVALLGASLLASPGAAVEPAHCYLGEPPADAPLTTTSPPPMMGFLDMLDVVTALHACGTEMDVHRTALDTERRGGGCSDSSEIAGWTDEKFAVSPDALRAVIIEEFAMTESAFEDWCRTLSVCEPTADGYSEACNAAFEAGFQ
ncbi:MAG: hypothetical protein AAFU49_07265 [Pseudomonadota bacterium]